MKRRNFTSKEATEVYKKTGGKCFYCGATLPRNTDYFDDGGKIVVTKRNWDIDHFVPFVHCNRTKSSK